MERTIKGLYDDKYWVYEDGKWVKQNAHHFMKEFDLLFRGISVPTEDAEFEVIETITNGKRTNSQMGNTHNLRRIN